MENFVKLRLPSNDVGQVIDGLTERMIIWKATEEYLETGFTQYECGIEECSDSEEARFIAHYYENIIESLNRQLERQRPKNIS